MRLRVQIFHNLSDLALFCGSPQSGMRPTSVMDNSGPFRRLLPQGKLERLAAEDRIARSALLGNPAVAPGAYRVKGGDGPQFGPISDSEEDAKDGAWPVVREIA